MDTEAAGYIVVAVVVHLEVAHHVHLVGVHHVHLEGCHHDHLEEDMEIFDGVGVVADTGLEDHKQLLHYTD